MIRWLNVFLLLACVGALVGVYGLKFQSEEIAKRKADLTHTIASQEDELSLLRADWAYLNQPSHIEPIVNRHADVLNLAMIGPKQFMSVDDLPMRPEKPDAAALTALLKALESGVDPIAALIEAN